MQNAHWIKVRGWLSNWHALERCSLAAGLSSPSKVFFTGQTQVFTPRKVAEIRATIGRKRGEKCKPEVQIDTELSSSDPLGSSHEDLVKAIMLREILTEIKRLYNTNAKEKRFSKQKAKKRQINISKFTICSNLP